jgi:hypothetical protein
MDRFKIWLIRKRIWLYVILLIFIIVLFYSFFKPNECTYDFWKIVSLIADYLSNSNISSKWNHLLLSIIFLLIPILVVYAISVFIFPVQPWNLLNIIGKKRSNSAKLCYALLETQLEDLVQKIQDLNKGIKVSQDEANEIQEKVLPIVSKTDWYITTILEPDEIWKDSNHKNSIEYTITNAKARNIKLTRFIVTNNITNLKSEVNTSGTAMNEISKLHKRNGYSLLLIEQEKFQICFNSCGVDNEYLDFLLVEGEVVIGLKNKVISRNGSTKYRTFTENETYLLFIKDTPNELEKYKKLITKLQLPDNHDNSPNDVTLK